MQTYMELKCITYFLLLYSLSSNIQLAENVVVYVVQKETCQEAKTNEVNKLNISIDMMRMLIFQRSFVKKIIALGPVV